ncbi:MAG: response regulator [Phascolarctobacterium sp.]|nr:response regulator [Phascolarctobacterium sp.]
MSEVSLRAAKNSLTTYDMICVWDICISDGTVRMVQDFLRPEITNQIMDYQPMVNWLADNYIHPVDKNEFNANLDIAVLREIKEDKHFSVRTRFPDGIIRRFVYILTPSATGKQDHIYFSIFDLDNDIDVIKGNSLNFVPITVKVKEVSSYAKQTPVSFYVFLGAMFFFVALGLSGFINSTFAFIGIFVSACGAVAFAYNDSRNSKEKRQEMLGKFNESIVMSARNMSKNISAEKAVNTSRSRFLSCVSQDFRTPMNNVVGMTVLAKKRLNDPQYINECLDKIVKENSSMVELIDNIVDISEAEAGTMQLNKGAFSLQELFSELFDSVAQTVLEKKLTLDVRNHDIRREYLIGDEARIKSIYRQLLTNAVKYTSEKGRIAIDIKEESIPGKRDNLRLVFVIQDNGHGIPKEYMKEMYNAFSRAEDNRIQKIKGTGLGLALTKHLIDLMDGTIACESEENVGTKFTVTIDLPVTGMDSNTMAIEPMKILLIDDDKLSLDCEMKMFKEMGCTVDGVENASKVEEVLQGKSDYGLIVIDYHMEKVHTAKIIGDIRALVGVNVPILLAGPFSQEYIEKDFADLDVNGYVQKPCFKSEVFIDLMKYSFGKADDTKKETKKEQEEITLEGLNVLIAEDNDLNWEIMAEILETAGAISVRAENGFECVDKIFGSKDNEYDVILMDIQMPYMDGIAATREIRKSKRDYVKNIPIIAMTADSFSETFKECQEAGMNGYVTKPVNIDALFVELYKLKK